MEPISARLDDDASELLRRRVLGFAVHHLEGVQQTVTRAQVAAWFALRLSGVVAHAPKRQTIVVTDLRGHWAATSAQAQDVHAFIRRVIAAMHGDAVARRVMGLIGVGDDERFATFDGRTANLVKQYNGYSPLPGMNVNGQLTLGENIADLAGLTVAQAAYHLSLQGKEPPVLDGFTGEQRLFLGYAQVWRYKAREETARQRILTDPHSPPEFRVNGAVRNVDAWYRAFNVKPGDKLYLPPARRVRIW